MAIAEDASTPVTAHSLSGTTVTTIVTASFSPPAGSQLVVMGGWGYSAAWTNTAPTLTVSASAGGLTFTQMAFKQETIGKFLVSGMWIADVPTAPGAITVTLTRAGATRSATGQLSVRVITGAALVASQTGAIVNTNQIGSTTTFDLTPTQLNSQVYVQSLYSDGLAGQTMTPTTDTTDISVNIDTAIFTTNAHGKSATLVSALTATNYGWTNSDTTNVETITQGLEILPVAVAGTDYTANPADSLSAGDRLPPVPPDGLTATVISSTEIDLSWSMVAGALSYDVERDGAVISTGQTGRTLADTGRTASTTYAYNVRSVY